jgi:arylsulfatase A-like enzyme
MTARAFPATILAVAAFTAGTTGCARLPLPAASPAGRPNVLLVTIDTLRARPRRLLWPAGAVTPTLDGLAARGVRFATAVRTAPLTGPSHACLLTGLTRSGTGSATTAGSRCRLR